MSIANIQELMSNGIVVTKHAKARLLQRNISIADIKKAILIGTIIEEYPNRTPFPAYLIHGKDLTGKHLHVIIASNGKYLMLVTCYYPDEEHFENDNITRK